MKQLLLDKYSYMIGYGIGQYYQSIKEELESKNIHLDFLMDRRWEEGDITTFDGIPILRRRELREKENALVIIFPTHKNVIESIRQDLKEFRVKIMSINEILDSEKCITGRFLNENCTGFYKDDRGNIIQFDGEVPEGIQIVFKGRGNHLYLGKNLLISRLNIHFGTNGQVLIGDNTEIWMAAFYVSFSKINIGTDCLFSREVELRTHDAHHIFDADSHKRINYPRDINIGDQVWVGYRAMIFGGGCIGNGSIVGAGAITSGSFGEHCIIAGNPAKKIRENICWSREDTDYFNREYLEDCGYTYE